jgi:hypothetical protein
MSRVTFGTIVVRPVDERRDAIREALGPIRRMGYERGVFEVELGPARRLRVAVSSRDVPVLQQIDGLLSGIVERNEDGLVEASGSTDPDDLVGIAWFALAPVRSVGYGDGEYTIRLPRGAVVRYSASFWDAMVLRRFDEFLDRVAAENRDALEPAAA